MEKLSRLRMATMIEDARAASYMGLSFILVLLAIGGWGAFSYSLYAAKQESRFLRTEVGRLTAEREKLTSDLNQIRGEFERTRQALERTRTELERTQAELVFVKADAAFMAE